MSAAPLPTVEQWLSALVPRVRALRVAHGTTRLVAAALGAASFVLLLDAGLALPAWARGLFLSVWLTAVGVLTWRWVLVPWRGELPLSEVANEVGKRLPELAEPLRVAVVAPRASQADDTAQKLKAVNSAQAVPVRPVAGFVGGAALALLAVVATAALVPGSADRLRRVVAPWARPGAGAFRVVVTSGESVVRRGGSVTLTAYAERASSVPVNSPDAVLVTRDSPDGPEARTPMTADGLTFHATRANVAADFEYRVEVGAARSEWFRVSVLDAIELAPGTAIEVNPPEYAARGPARTLTTLSDVVALQFSTLTLKLKFTHPAAAGHLDWRTTGATSGEMTALDFAADHLSATARFPLRANGVLRLVLVREEGGKRLRTDHIATVGVSVDRPPRFAQLSGVAARPRTVTPQTRIPVAVSVRDDLGVAGVELQYYVGADESKRVSVPIPVTGVGTPQAAGRLDFDLSAKVREGDTLHVRVVVTDGREVGSEKLGPQSAAFPREGWSELRVAATAPPLAEQDIPAARDALHDVLESARKESKELGDEAAAIATAATGSDGLPFDLASRLGNAREKAKTLREALRNAADDTALVPGAHLLATAVLAAEQKMVAAEGALRRAETDSATARDEALAAAGDHFRAAGTAMTDLVAQNVLFARTKLDRLKLTKIAADQRALADAPPGPETATRQRELLTRFTTLLAESEPLRAAYTSAKEEELRRLATELAELTAHARELDSAAAQTLADARAALIAAITREHDASVQLAAALFAKSETALRLAGASPPRPDDYARVAKLADAGKMVEALTEIERYAQALDALADTVEKLTAERADPKVAAKHLAQWQDDILDRFRTAAKAGGFAAAPEPTKTALRREQKAIAAVLNGLALPPDESVTGARTEAARHVGLAADFLARDGTGAEDAMKAAVRALNNLSDRTPTAATRIFNAARGLDAIRADFDLHAGKVEETRAMFERQPEALPKRLAPYADKMRKQEAAVAALDAPGLAERRERVCAALRAAANDLQDGSQLDVQASQLWARRELERLKLALAADPLAQPPDTKAEELHRKLLTAADQLDAYGPDLTAKKAEAALPAVREVDKALAFVSSPDQQVMLNDTRVAVQAAEASFRDTKPDETRRLVRAAASQLGKLAERLHGAESEFARVKRLAALRRAAAERPKDLLTSEEPGKQLGREVDEFTRTRVGVGGQALKKKALDLYTKLRGKPDPDRVGTDLKALATTLDELATKMAEVVELTAGTPRPAPPATTDADEFLPSKPLADALRDLERRQHRLRAQVTALPADLAARLQPAMTDALAALVVTQTELVRDAQALAKEAETDAANKALTAAVAAAERLRVGRIAGAQEEAGNAANFFRLLATAGTAKPWGKRAAELVERQSTVLTNLAPLLDRSDAATARQAARAAELGHSVAEFARKLALVADSFDATDPARKSLTATTTALKDAEKHLAEAAKLFTEAEKHRAAAREAFRTASEALGTPGAGAVVAPGDALRATERAMRHGTAREAAEALERVK